MQRNIYDFDKTIFKFDSTKKFYFFAIKKYPKMLLCLPTQFIYFIPFSLGLLEKTKFKEKMYSAFKYIKNIDQEVELFWDKNKIYINSWYYKNQKDTDIIISASPEFLLEPICKKIGIKHLIASKVNPKTGEYTGINCYGKEKVKRLEKEFPETFINEFYSDSYSDEPLAKLAQKSYLVSGEKLYNWD